MKTKMVQLFLVGDATPEVNGALISQRFDDKVYSVTVGDDSDEQDVLRTAVPYAQIRMIRYFDA